MAKRSPSAVLMTTLILAFIFVFAYSATQVNGIGRVVGGRTKMKDVKTNQEVQELGRFSVEEYNRSQQRHYANGGGCNACLKFSEVVEAEQQVVSGIKYYLKIAAATSTGVPKTYDAEVVVKPWVHSRELLNFAPSPPTK